MAEVRDENGMTIEIPIVDMPRNRDERADLIARLSEMDAQCDQSIGEYFHSTPFGSAAAVLDLLVVVESNPLFGGGCLSMGAEPMVGVYFMNEDDALHNGGMYQYSPGMGVAKDNRYLSVSFRCIVVNSKIAKSRSKGAKYVQYIAPSRSVLVTSMVVRIRDRRVIHNG